MKIKLTEKEQKHLDRLLKSVNRGHYAKPARDRLIRKHMIFVYKECHTCRGPASYMKLTKVKGAELVERYCDSCIGIGAKK